MDRTVTNKMNQGSLGVKQTALPAFNRWRKRSRVRCAWKDNDSDLRCTCNGQQLSGWIENHLFDLELHIWSVERLRIHRQHIHSRPHQVQRVNLVCPRLSSFRIREIGNPYLVSHGDDEVHIPNAYESAAAGRVLAAARLEFRWYVEYWV